MELTQVYELWNRFDNSSAVELTLEFQGTKLCLRKDMAHNNPPSIGVSTPAISTTETASAAKALPSVSDSPETEKVIKAPLVGIFYRAASPDAEPFVKVGQAVKKGDVIGIIEAMKLMNEVTASEDGVVAEIVVSDAAFVEYDQVLIRLK